MKSEGNPSMFVRLISLHFLVLLLLGVFSSQAYAAVGFSTMTSKGPSNAPAELIVMSADWCIYCRKLDPVLRSTFPNGSLEIAHNGKKILLSYRIVDVSDDEINASTKKLYGRFVALPAVFLRIGDQISRAAYGSVDLKALFETTDELLSMYYGDTPTDFQVPRRLGLGLGVVTFVSTGVSLRSVPVTNSEKMALGEDSLVKNIGIKRDQIFQLYTNGRDLSASDGQKALPLSLAAPSDWSGLRYVSKSMTSSRLPGHTLNHLFVMAGHGDQSFGTFLWDSGIPFDREALSSFIANSQSNTIVLSGTCFSGQYARAENLSCGFFAARPDLTATGCSSTKAGPNAPDYLTGFFNALGAWENGKLAADLNNDREISFSEAHWYSVVRGTWEDVPYTSLDALTDTILKNASADSFAQSLSYSEIMGLKNYASPGELATLSRLFNRNRVASYINQHLSFPTRDIAKNKIYSLLEIDKARIGQIARRLLAKRILDVTHSEERRQQWSKIEKCEDQSIARFLWTRN